MKALAVGTSIRGTVRLTGAAKDTVTKLLVEVGTVCADYQDQMVRDLRCTRVKCDEIWAFVSKKEKHVVPAERGQGKGDVWTWMAMCATSKVIFSYYVGKRDQQAAHAFMDDVAARLANRVQLTTDGLSIYLPAVEDAFGWNGVDYAMLVKTYGTSPADEGQKRYSPAVFTGAIKNWVMGKPDESLVSTSYIERANLTLRMSQRRFTRLTNAFSKKIENHQHAVALHLMHYNYCRKHQTLTEAKGGIHQTPAMAAGLTDHVWKVEEVIGLI
ncbi:MAG TPA: IS1 family transposase [Gemmatimonadaceae bacterium]|nr:IS1 family transposase [Gemmatimonadaceae bacterium]